MSLHVMVIVKRVDAIDFVCVMQSEYFRQCKEVPLICVTVSSFNFTCSYYYFCRERCIFL